MSEQNIFGFPGRDDVFEPPARPKALQPFTPPLKDYKWIMETFPAIKELEGVAHRFDDQAEADKSDILGKLDELGLTAQVRKGRRRFLEDYGDAYLGVVYAAGALASREPDPEAQLRRCVDVLTPFFVNSPNKDHGPYLVGKDAARHAGFHHALSEMAGDTYGKVQEVLNGGTETEFRILQILADAGVRDWSQAERTMPSEGLCLLVSEAANDMQVENPAVQLGAKLEEGVYDSLIARRLIAHASGIDKPGSDDTRLARVRELVDFVEIYDDATPNEARITRLAETAKDWPGDARLVFSLGKQALREATTASTTFADKALDKLGLNRPTDSTDALEAAISNHVQIELKNNPVVAGQQSDRHRIMKARVDSKKAHMKRLQEQPVERPDIAKIQKPRQLVVTDGSGNTYPRGSKEFDDVIGKYFGKGAREQKLVEDVETILDYVASLDYEQDLRGIKTYTKDNNVTSEQQIRGLKVPDAVGLPTSTKRAKKIRVLFTVRDEEIELIALVDRANLGTLNRTLGIGNMQGD